MARKILKPEIEGLWQHTAQRSVVRTSFVGGGPFAVGNELARAPGFSNLPPLSLLSGDQRSISDSPETLFGRIRPPPVMVPVIFVSHCTGLHQ